MTSVINSARRSTASLFDLVGVSAGTVTQLVTTAARSVDALDAKASVFHQRIIINAKAQMVLIEDDEATKAATQHTDLMEEVHRRNFPHKEFNREQFFNAALEKIQAAISAK